MAGAIHSLSDVVVPSRGHEAGTLSRRVVVLPRLSDGRADLGAQSQPAERFPAAAHAHEIRAAVGRPPLVVGRDALGAVIGEGEIEAVQGDLADAQRPDLAEVCLEDQPVLRDVAGGDRFEDGLELVQAGGE